MPRLFTRKTAKVDRRFGYAVVGAGHGSEKMCQALRDSPHARVSAVVSGSPTKAKKLARRFGVPKTYSYEQFDAIAADSSIDAVYLALPVAPHRKFTELAAAAGKHVLCEKPMAASVDDAQAMIAACEAAGKLLMVAYRLDYDPMHHELQRLLQANALGALRQVSSGFGFVAKPGWRFDPALAGGGSLFDVGVYPIHALHEFFGETKLTSAEIVEDPKTHLELEATWRGTLEGGATFECRSSYLKRIPDSLQIEGERGTLRLEHAFAYERTRLVGEYRDERGALVPVELHDARWNPSLFRLEAEHLAQCARSGETPRSSGEAGVRDLLTVAAIEAMATRMGVGKSS
jgi:predicted dehydrogenase